MKKNLKTNKPMSLKGGESVTKASFSQRIQMVLHGCFVSENRKIYKLFQTIESEAIQLILQSTLVTFCCDNAMQQVNTSNPSDL